MLKGVPLPETMGLTTDMGAVKGCGAVVMATPSFAVRATAAKLKQLADPGTIVISVSKGIEKDTSLRLSQVIEEELQGHCPWWCSPAPPTPRRWAAMSPTGVVAASEDLELARQVQDLFMNPASGLHQHRQGGHRAVRRPEEHHRPLRRLLRRHGLRGQHQGTAHDPGAGGDGPAGGGPGRKTGDLCRAGRRGDLIVTCCSMHSRNRRCGILIGKGVEPKEAVKEIGAVVEGYYAAVTARTLAQKAGIEMPIAQAAYEVLYEGRDVHAVVTDLMSRAKRSETEESSWT